MLLLSLPRRIAIALLIAAAAIALLWRIQPGLPTSGEGTNLALRMPSFIQVAHAADTGISAISEQAGFAAWFQASSPINLANIRDQYRTIETETSDYIIGSVAVGDYPESEDVHVYMHKAGWIMAYYLKTEPVTKAIDWRDFEANGLTTLATKFENTIANLMVIIGSPFDGVTYYDFRYPNATHVMLIAEANDGAGCGPGDNAFGLNVPLALTVYERSWFAGGSQGARISLNGGDVGSSGGGNDQGALLVTQLPPDEFHTVEVHKGHCAIAHGGIGLVYREQQ